VVLLTDLYLGPYCLIYLLMTLAILFNILDIFYLLLILTFFLPSALYLTVNYYKLTLIPFAIGVLVNV